MDNGNPGESFDPKKLLVSTSRGRMVRLYDKGDVVFKQADAADAVLYIRKGNIKIAVASRQGKETARLAGLTATAPDPGPRPRRAEDPVRPCAKQKSRCVIALDNGDTFHGTHFAVHGSDSTR